MRRLGARFSLVVAPKDGASITGVTSKWLLTISSSPTPSKTNGSWGTTYQQPTAQRPYLWRYDTYTMSSGPNKESDVWLAEAFGQAVIRPTVWETGKQYYAGNKGEPYRDIVVFTDGRQYECSETHISSDGTGGTTDNRPTAGSSNQYWRLGDQRRFISTELLLASQALINLAQTNSLRVMQADGTTVAAAMGGGQFPLWVGAPTPQLAPFRVSIDGLMHAVDAELRNGFFTGFHRTIPTVITAETAADYLATGEDWPWLEANNSVSATAAIPAHSSNDVTAVFSLDKTGCCIVFNGVDFLNAGGQNVYAFLHLPFIYAGTGRDSLPASFYYMYRYDGQPDPQNEIHTDAELAAEKWRARSYEGCSIEIYNVGATGYNQSLRICGLKGSLGILGTAASPWEYVELPKGYMLRATCKRPLGTATFSNSEFSAASEQIYWEVEAVLKDFTLTELGLQNS